MRFHFIQRNHSEASPSKQKPAICRRCISGVWWKLKYSWILKIHCCGSSPPYFGISSRILWCFCTTFVPSEYSPSIAWPATVLDRNRACPGLLDGGTSISDCCTPLAFPTLVCHFASMEAM
nr:hypothetical protein Itr_chr03CG05900 [Ipomoea trifida]